METWSYNPNEDEPVAHINVGEREFEVNRGNTRLFTFMGRLALYNHVHYSDRENDVAFYVFNFVNGYNELASFVAENDFTMYLNQTEVPQCDLDAYDRAIKASMKGLDSVPEDWLDE